jgi:molybdopterin/thiamine biosynthesis adenylyltransferase
MNISKVYRRQLGLVTPRHLDFPVLVIGAGGIGSWTVLALAKMGCQNICVIDYDKVEDKNAPAQLYSQKHVGQYKVEVLQELVKDLTGTTIDIRIGRMQDSLDINVDWGVVVCAVDSLEERRIIFEYLKNINHTLYIDARMAGELIRIFTVATADVPTTTRYVKSLFSPAPPHREKCTERSVVYNTFICGGLIASVVKKFARQEPIKTQIIMDITTISIY